MTKKLIVKDRDKFETPQYEFFVGLEIVESKYLPDDVFVVIDGDKFMTSTMYIFKYKGTELYYHKIPPVWNINLPIVEDPYEKDKFYPAFTQQFKISQVVL